MKHASSVNPTGPRPHSDPDKDRSFTIFDRLAWAIMILAGTLFIFVVLAGTDEDVREKELKLRFVDN